MKKSFYLLITVLMVFGNLSVAEAKTAYEQCYEGCRDTCVKAYQQAIDNGDYSGISECTKNCATGQCKVYAENNPDISVDEESNTYKKIQCGDLEVPTMFVDVVHIVYTILMVVVPILIVLFGSIDLFKAIIAQKEDEIRKGQHIFVRRLILGIIVFLVFALVQFVIGLVAPKNSNESMWSCVDCFINGDC